MINDEQLGYIIETVTQNVLTPVIYMYEEEILELIVFCDGNMDINILRDTEQNIYMRTGVKAELVDIREFDEYDRLQIVQNAQLVYAVDETVLSAFEAAMRRDVEFIAINKAVIAERRMNTGSYHTM